MKGKTKNNTCQSNSSKIRKRGRIGKEQEFKQQQQEAKSDELEVNSS